jgi:mRNA-degrading endonuclease RelE of RelBE toxin-antitoxin system
MMVYLKVQFTVGWKKRIEKDIKKMPDREQEKFVQLVHDLMEKGPIQNNWPNFSSLGANKYHCHLSYHWVACWKTENENIIIEVYYVGSRENAPY